MKKLLLFSVTLLYLLISCQREQTSWNFNDVNDRIWIGREFWAVPLENWMVKDGRVECTGSNHNMRVNVLSRMLAGTGRLDISLKAGLINGEAGEGSFGIRIGIKDHTDMDVRSLCYYGKGLDIGIDLSGKMFIAGKTAALPEGFDFSDFIMMVTADITGENKTLHLKVTDKSGTLSEMEYEPDELSGMIAVVNNFDIRNNPDVAAFWFDNLNISGNMVEWHEENCFGPILFNMYTLSRDKMKMSVQMPPIGNNDEQEIELQLKEGDVFNTISKATIQKDARIALFEVDNWDSKIDHIYRVVYNEKLKNGKIEPDQLEGIIPADPGEKELVMGGLTCQEWQAYPYRPVSENMAKLNPDILYFSGDQIYEGNGGYGIVREDPGLAITNYLGKWFMFGWAFGDVMKDRPTICIPDDHEMYQGNLWGDGGKKISLEEWQSATDCTSGIVQPLEMVNVVMKTNCAHLPDPWDPEPMDNGIPVYYTELVYGRVSFAIVGDRIFKSGPENVSWWKGRKDHVKIDLKDPGLLEKEGLKFLGDRQIAFLENWVENWEGADMKCILSQTVFSNAATHHGGDKMFLYGDLDSGGWPKKGRDRAVSVIRKCFAYHICGDQHIPSLQQYGIDNQRDAGWVFCTPAISVGYQRRFHPDRLSGKIQNRPEHNLPNTGEYKDLFGNYFYMYAIGNPVDEPADDNRYTVAQNRASGFGIIRFNKKERSYEADAIRFLADLDNLKAADHFPGWPKTVYQSENYGRKADYFLPHITCPNGVRPVIRIRDKSGELVYSLRLDSDEYQPRVFLPGIYSIEAGDYGGEEWLEFENVVAARGGNDKVIKL